MDEKNKGSSRPSGPNNQRRREDLPARGGSTSRAGAPRQSRNGSDPRGTRAAPMDRDQSRLRPRIFEPDIPEEITGEELDKSLRAELLSLSPENAKVVARHLECLALYADSDPLLAHKHGVAAAHHAGRLAVVRESAGYAAYRAGFYEIALKELRAANRISGDVTMWPVMADCERGLGNPLKALALAGSPEVKRLAKAEEIEMRIVASGARRDLGELDAAVVTLTCKELSNESEEWAVRLRYAYADSLEAAGRRQEAREWFEKCASIDSDESTDVRARLDL
ncbi:MAG: tetratricopeptide repeat protein [Candidatus Planktophila sp.]|jgi:tetratricopeptide (TPR) repeat protein|nr:tetratricopeptide repeat protein [Candidatus Planktophila sp.]